MRPLPVESIRSKAAVWPEGSKRGRRSLASLVPVTTWLFCPEGSIW